MNRFDFSTAPYNSLTSLQRQTLEKATDIVFFDDQATVIQANDSIDALYIVIKGMIQEVDADGEVLALYHPSDSFDTRLCLSRLIAIVSSLLIKACYMPSQKHHSRTDRKKQRIWCVFFCQYR